MKDKFITFLKKAHAWEEFKKELYTQNKLGNVDNALFDVFEYVEEREISHMVLGNGSFFFWDKARGETDWESLSNEWSKLVTDIHAGETELPHNMKVHVKFIERRKNGNFLWSCNGVMLEGKNILEVQKKYLRSDDVEVY